MPIDANSSRSDVLNAYLDNADYASAGSVAQAKDFARACRLLMSMPQESGDRDGNVRMRLEQYERELADVNAWLARHAPAVPSANVASTVTMVSFNDGRR